MENQALNETSPHFIRSVAHFTLGGSTKVFVHDRSLAPSFLRMQESRLSNALDPGFRSG